MVADCRRPYPATRASVTIRRGRVVFLRLRRDGGLSGAPLASRALEVLRILRRVLPADACVISVGGVDTAADVQARLDAGATLVQGYTAFLYEGPFWATRINRQLAKNRGVQRPGA